MEPDWHSLADPRLPHWDETLDDLLANLEKHAQNLPAEWSETILKIGANILEKGSREQRYRILEAA